MANHAPTAASVLKSDSGATDDGLSLEAIAQGDALYKTAAGTFGLAINNDTLAKATVAGIALNGVAAAAQPVKVVTLDTLFACGFTIASGVGVYVSATAGKMCPIADVGTPKYLSLVGLGVGSNKINLKPVIGGAI